MTCPTSWGQRFASPGEPRHSSSGFLTLLTTTCWRSLQGGLQIWAKAHREKHSILLGFTDTGACFMVWHLPTGWA